MYYSFRIRDLDNILSRHAKVDNAPVNGYGDRINQNVDTESFNKAGVRPHTQNYPLVPPEARLTDDKPLKIILLFHQQYLFTTTFLTFMSKCPHLQKKIDISFHSLSDKNSFFPDDADFVVFYMNRPGVFKSFSDFLQSVNYSGVRNPRQRWVLLNQEPPLYSLSSYEDLSEMGDIFNFTMHYSQLADIVFPYGHCVLKQAEQPADPSGSQRRLLGVNRKKEQLFNRFHRVGPLLLTSEQLGDGRHHDRKKRQRAWEIKSNHSDPDGVDVDDSVAHVVWVSSHCITANNREGYVEELAKYIEVAVYGTCGNAALPKCPQDQSFSTCMLERNTFFNKYKFYLSFENCLCNDYASEKVFEPLFYKRKTVPVVLGGGPYEHMLPRGSYIDVADFKSPKLLATYLKHLIENPEEYDTYFSWHKDYECTMFAANACTLCDSLLTLSIRSNVVTSSKLYEIFGDYHCPKEQKQYANFSNRANMH